MHSGLTFARITIQSLGKAQFHSTELLMSSLLVYGEMVIGMKSTQQSSSIAGLCKSSLVLSDEMKAYHYIGFCLLLTKGDF